MIFDVKLPKMDGFSAVKEILDSEKDIEEGFLSGGDDYIKKPFSLKELKYRIDAIIKRAETGVVSKEEIFEYLYGLDEPNEKVLGKDSIETISGRGFNFFVWKRRL
nr:response regulator transcription factor [Lebetimonas sp. JH292]